MNSLKLLPVFLLLLLCSSPASAQTGQTSSSGGIGPGNLAPSTHARILSKPQPVAPKEISSVPEVLIVLRAVFTADGRVTNVHFVKAVPKDAPKDTIKLFKQRSIEAAKQIEFIPATKGGRPVAMYIQLEYSFGAAKEETQPAATPPDSESSKPEKPKPKG
jgi:hypothetical protein